MFSQELTDAYDAFIQDPNYDAFRHFMAVGELTYGEEQWTLMVNFFIKFGGADFYDYLVN